MKVEAQYFSAGLALKRNVRVPQGTIESSSLFVQCNFTTPAMIDRPLTGRIRFKKTGPSTEVLGFYFHWVPPGRPL